MHLLSSIVVPPEFSFSLSVFFLKIYKHGFFQFWIKILGLFMWLEVGFSHYFRSFFFQDFHFFLEQSSFSVWCMPYVVFIFLMIFYDFTLTNLKHWVAILQVWAVKFSVGDKMFLNSSNNHWGYFWAIISLIHFCRCCFITRCAQK